MIYMQKKNNPPLKKKTFMVAIRAQIVYYSNQYETYFKREKK